MTDETTRLRALLEQTERERDDLAALNVARVTAHALAMARVRELEAIIAGRTTPPADAEIETHAAHDGVWLYNYRGKNLSVVARVNTLRVEAEGCRTGQITGSRWWPLDAEGRPCAWPTAEVSRAE